MRRYQTWLREEERQGEPIAGELAALDFPPATIDVLARMFDDAMTVGVARKLTARAHALITSSPKKSAALALLAARVADASGAPPEFVPALDTTRGEAWMRYGAAIFELGNFPAAWEAAERAETYFDLASPFPPAVRSATTLGLIQGKILHFLGRTDEGLLRIEQSANLILNVFEEPAKYVEAMTIYNAILMHANRWEEAAERWAAIGGLAREKGDKATLGYVVTNVGRCYLQLGRSDDAGECFATALEIFEDLGLKTELPDLRLNMAYALRLAGRYSEAISEMYVAREEFAKLGMLLNAAEVTVRIVETRILGNRNGEIVHDCEEAVRFFGAAGMPEQARKAADYLLEAARRNTLRLDAVAAVCTFLSRLRDQPDERFREAM
jgi:tetratricopeptide (TPR) repeat protein